MTQYKSSSPALDRQPFGRPRSLCAAEILLLIFIVANHSKLLMTCRPFIRPMNEDPTCLSKNSLLYEAAGQVALFSPSAIHFLSQMCYTKL